jgi:hypothetical protein
METKHAKSVHNQRNEEEVIAIDYDRLFKY